MNKIIPIILIRFRKKKNFIYIMIARNNIFNIRANGAKWVGQTGANKGFAEFDTQEHAIRAWLVLMRTYRRKHGLTTIRDIINRFAPPTENNTEKYVRYCCTVTLKGSTEPITNKATYYVLGQAMARMETGTGLSYDAIASVANKFNIRIIR